MTPISINENEYTQTQLEQYPAAEWQTFGGSSYFDKFFGTVFSNFVGFEILCGTSKVLVSASAWPLLGITLMAYPLTYVPWAFIGRGLRELMCQSHPFARMATIFLFNAAMTFLTGWIGLLIVTSFTAMAFNPVTLPCLIGVAVAGAVVFAAAAAVALRMRYVAMNGSSAYSVAGQLLHALDPRTSRPFNYHKAFSASIMDNDAKSVASFLYVRPFGVVEQVGGYGQTWSIFGKVKNVTADAVASEIIENPSIRISKQVRRLCATDSAWRQPPCL